jgi:hypothetical protein
MNRGICAGDRDDEENRKDGKKQRRRGFNAVRVICDTGDVTL